MGDVHDEKLAKLIGYNIAKQLNKKGKTQKDLCKALNLQYWRKMAYFRGLDWVRLS